MSDRVFIDTNIVIYALTDASAKGTIALNLLESKPCISTQVVAESINVCLRKFKFTKEDTYARADKLIYLSELFVITQSTLKEAFQLSLDYQFSFWDSLIVASALENNCSILYSEDLQHNQLIDGKLRIQNPFI
jgi:predicted nucleic acid-binding protein